MSIINAAPPERDFTRVPNAWLRDRALSYRAKGLLAYIASHASSYSLTVEQIIAESREGRDAVRTAMAELIGLGYVTRKPVRERGRIVRYDYQVNTAAQEPADGFPGDGFPGGSCDQAKQRVSAGETTDQETVAGQPPTKKTNPSTEGEKTKEKTKPSASPRGTRLPDGWMPDEKLKEWFLAEYGTGGSFTPALADKARVEMAKFADYWAAQPGQRGVKLDWDATWRNWMRKAFEGWRPGATPAAAGQFKNSAEKQADKAARDKVRGKLVDELLDKGMPVQAAFDAVEAELRRREALGEVISLDACLVPGYIDAKTIDGSTTPTREVTA